MKKTFCILLALLMITFSAVTVGGASIDIADQGKTIITIGDWVYSAIDGGSHLQIEEYIGSGTELVIPRIVNNLMVVSIGDHCFMDNSTVTSVETSSPLWTVGEYAFLNAAALETFICNFALKEIGASAFYGTTSLKNINIEDSVVTVIRPHTFTDSGIEQISLPDTCTEIMHDAFSQCHQLTKIVIPESVITIDNDAFKFSENVVIYCYSDSYAHQYAEDNNIPYVLLSDSFILGDTDGDNSVDVVDATWIQRYTAQMDVTPINATLMNGDVDDDGTPTVIDATFIMRYSVYIQTPYAIGELVTRA